MSRLSGLGPALFSQGSSRLSQALQGIIANIQRNREIELQRQEQRRQERRQEKQQKKAEKKAKKRRNVALGVSAAAIPLTAGAGALTSGLAAGALGSGVSHTLAGLPFSAAAAKAGAVGGGIAGLGGLAATAAPEAAPALGPVIGAAQDISRLPLLQQQAGIQDRRLGIAERGLDIREQDAQRRADALKFDQETRFPLEQATAEARQEAARARQKFFDARRESEFGILGTKSPLTRFAGGLKDLGKNIADNAAKVLAARLDTPAGELESSLLGAGIDPQSEEGQAFFRNLATQQTSPKRTGSSLSKEERLLSLFDPNLTIDQLYGGSPPSALEPFKDRTLKEFSGFTGIGAAPKLGTLTRDPELDELGTLLNRELPFSLENEELDLVRNRVRQIVRDRLAPGADALQGGVAPPPITTSEITVEDVSTDIVSLAQEGRNDEAIQVFLENEQLFPIEKRARLRKILGLE